MTKQEALRIMREAGIHESVIHAYETAAEQTYGEKYWNDVKNKKELLSDVGLFQEAETLSRIPNEP